MFGSWFIPLARRVTNVVEARLIDLLFPTEERNFAVDAPPRAATGQCRGAGPAASADHAPACRAEWRDGPASAVAMSIRSCARRLPPRQGHGAGDDDQLRQLQLWGLACACIREAMVLGNRVPKGPMVLNRTKKVEHRADRLRQGELIET